MTFEECAPSPLPFYPLPAAKSPPETTTLTMTTTTERCKLYKRVWDKASAVIDFGAITYLMATVLYYKEFFYTQKMSHSHLLQYRCNIATCYGALKHEQRGKHEQGEAVSE